MKTGRAPAKPEVSPKSRNINFESLLEIYVPIKPRKMASLLPSSSVIDPNKTVGTLSNAPTTEAGYAISIAKYNDFAQSNGFPFYKALTVEFLERKDEEEGSSMCCSLFNRFRKYLQLPISKKKNAPYYKPGACAQYFSGLKTVLSKRFPNLRLLHPPYDE